jgi:hypothetical protein
MKKLFILLVFLAFVTVARSQTVIKSDMVVNYQYADTLQKDDTVAVTYYVKDFVVNARLTVITDSLSTGYSKTNTILYGSADYVNWTALTGNYSAQTLALTINADSTQTGTFTPSGTSTISIAGTDGGSSSIVYKDLFYPYLKVQTIAVDSTQNNRYIYKLVIDKN